MDSDSEKAAPRLPDDGGSEAFGGAAWILKEGRDVIRLERESLREVESRLGESFVEAVRLIRNGEGRVAVTGLGKAGDIGRKIHATFSSTGTPAYVLHPVEALHGDLGMIRREDVVLALSKSGTTQELVSLLPRLSGFGCRLILITGAPQSLCAKQCDVVIDIGAAPEACPLGMAPSSSTAAMLGVGDALALTVMRLKNVRPEEYARYHPGGALGRSLMRVSEIMRVGADCPKVNVNATLREYHLVVHGAPRRAGAAAVVDDDGRLVGIFTHGDLSRLLDEPEHPALRRLGDVMTANPKTVHCEARVVDALRVMQPHRIDEVLVVDDEHKVVGLVDIQDLLAEGFSLFDNG
jgi:arabinose-5-phosphate isomerase